MIEKRSVAIIGAGVAGLCLATELLRAGHRVTLIDKGDLSASTSWAAAGMLAPTYEAATESPGHSDFFELLECARAHCPIALNRFGIGANDVGFIDRPSVALAMSAGQASLFRRLEKHGRARAFDVAEWPGRGQPDSTCFKAAFWLQHDGQVDNRAFVERLHRGVRASGAGIVRRAVDPVAVSAKDLSVECVVDARGWCAPGMTPVKGTAVSLAPHPGLPDRVVRWGHNYLVPKAGRVVLGAHTLPGLTDTSVDPAVVEELLEEAALVFPAVLETPVLEKWSGIRPRSADGAPVLGWTGEGRYQISGLYRDGFLLAPLLAYWACLEITGQTLPDLAKRFAPSRFGVTA